MFFFWGFLCVSTLGFGGSLEWNAAEDLSWDGPHLILLPIRRANQQPCASAVYGSLQSGWHRLTSAGSSMHACNGCMDGGREGWMDGQRDG